MRRVALSSASIFIAICGSTATVSADDPGTQQRPAQPSHWSGWHVGTQTGGALDKSDISNPYGSSLFGDDVRSPGSLAGIAIGYDKQYGALILGVEADVSRADLDGHLRACSQPHTLKAMSQISGAPHLEPPAAPSSIGSAP